LKEIDMNIEQLKQKLESSNSLKAAEAKETLIPLCEALMERGVESVEAEYCGFGDSGAVEAVSYLPEEAKVPPEIGDIVELWITSSLPAGWEIDAGSQGSVVIDVAARVPTSNMRRR
jgi:hypothetical protein